MPEHLNTLADVQLTLGELHVTLEVMSEGLQEAVSALLEVAEEAAARGELAMACRTVEKADAVADKLRALTALQRGS